MHICVTRQKKSDEQCWSHNKSVYSVEHVCSGEQHIAKKISFLASRQAGFTQLVRCLMFNAFNVCCRALHVTVYNVPLQNTARIFAFRIQPFDKSDSSVAITNGQKWKGTMPPLCSGSVLYWASVTSRSVLLLCKRLYSSHQKSLWSAFHCNKLCGIICSMPRLWKWMKPSCEHVNALQVYAYHSMRYLYVCVCRLELNIKP